MKKTTQTSCIGLMYCLFSHATAVAQTTSNVSVSPRFSGSFTTTGAGYQEPYFSVEGFIPFQATLDNSLTFAQARMLWSTDSTMGGNLVLGHRFAESDDVVWGGYIAYDVRDTGNKFFSQIGVGLERLGNNWDLRVNGYLPVGDSKQEVGESLAGWRFARNNLLLDIQKHSQVALAGLDIEAGGQLSRLGQGDLRGYAGLYYYTGESIDGALGVRGRLEANPTNNLRFGVTMQHDPIFDTRVVLNASVELGSNSASVQQKDIRTRFANSVKRTPTITVAEKTENSLEVATNPQTGQPWQFRHVTPGTGTATGDGSIENPTSSVQAALNIAQPEDIVYVEFSQTVLAGFNIPDQVAVLSTAPVQTIETSEAGKVQLPKSGSGASPVVNGTVAMGNNTTLSGFALSNIGGNAIQASGVSNVTIRDNQITNPTGQGVSLSGVGGSNLIARNIIQNTGSQGIFLQGFGDNQQVFNLDGNNISNSGGQGIFAQAANNSQQVINLTDTVITNTIGAGFFAQANNNSRQNITIAGLGVRGTLKDSLGNGGHGIFVTANSGVQSFKLENSQISDTAAQGAFIAANNGGKQNFTIDSANINRSVGQGMFIQANDNASQEFIINKATVTNTAKDSNNDGGQGIFIAGNNGATQKFDVNDAIVNNNASQGLFVANSGGQQNFNVNKINADNNSAQGVFIQANGNLIDPTIQTQQSFTLNNPAISGSTGQGIFVQANGNVRQEFTITNGKISDTKLYSSGSGGQGIFIQANGTAQQNSNVKNTSVVNSAGQGIFVQANGDAQAKVSLTNNTITNSINNDIFLQTNGESQLTAIAELNNLENQFIDGISAGMNSNQTMCLAPRNNKIKTGSLLQRNNGTFQVVDRDNFTTNNGGTVTFQPDKSNFANVATCP